MGDYFASLGNVVVDRSPDELIGAVMVALMLSLALAGLYCLGRRKVIDNLMPVVVILIVANLLSMAVGAGYLAYAKRRFLPGTPPGVRARGPVVSEAILVDTIFREADANRDGLISGEEASLAANTFVKKTDPTGNGLIDPRSLRHAIVGTEMHGRGRFGRSSRPVNPFMYRRRNSPIPEPPAEALPVPSDPSRPEPDTKNAVSSTDAPRTADNPKPEQSTD